jgi:hypothetical protein
MENAYRIIYIGNIISTTDTGWNERTADSVLQIYSSAIRRLQ